MNEIKEDKTSLNIQVKEMDISGSYSWKEVDENFFNDEERDYGRLIISINNVIFYGKGYLNWS